MRPGLSPAPARNAARVAKLGLSLAGFAGETGTGVRAELAQRTAAEALSAATKAEIGLYHGAEGAEGLMRHVGEGRFVLHLKSEGLGAEQLEGRLTLARERMRAMRPFSVMIDGAHLCSTEGHALWAAALAFRELGLISSLGVSVEPGGDALGLARRFKPDLMRVSAGLLDQRLIAGGALAEIAGLGVEVHIRAALLHGLLFLPREGLPAVLAEAGPQVSRVRRMIAEGGADPLQAALAFVLDRPEASGVIVEAASAGEVRALVAAAAAPTPQLDWPALALDCTAALDAEARLGRRAA